MFRNEETSLVGRRKSGDIGREKGTVEVTYNTKPSQDKKVAMVRQYILGDVLGEGSYGKVIEALDSATLRRVAIKEIKKRRLKRHRFGRKAHEGEQKVKREIAIMRHVGAHPNVTKLMEVIESERNQKMYMVLEYASGTLRELLKANAGPLPALQVQSYLRQLILGLEFIHSKGVIHRDIKPDNIMIDASAECVKISDFGVAQTLDIYTSSDFITSSVGSPAFQPPEVASGHLRFSGPKADVWALGVTLFNMCTGEYPFHGRNKYHLLDNIAKGVFTIPDFVSDTLLRDLIEGMLTRRPTRRFGLASIKHHPWLHNLIEDEAEFVRLPNVDRLSSVIAKLNVLFENMEEERILILKAADRQAVMDLFKVNPLVFEHKDEVEEFPLPMTSLLIQTGTDDGSSSRSELSSEFSTQSFTGSLGDTDSWLRSSSNMQRRAERRLYAHGSDAEDKNEEEEEEAGEEPKKKGRCVTM